MKVISPTLALLAAAGVSLGLLESASSQTRPPDLDRDGVPNLSDRDVDNDGVANGLDGNVDGDALANLQDPDLDGTGVDDSTLDILYEVPGNPRAYADDALAAESIAFVSAEVRKALQIPDNDPGLRVRVQVGDGTDNQVGRWGGLVTGVWRYFSADRIQVWAKWCYPAADPDPAKLRIFASYTYKGPYSDRIEDYANPENYDVSDESKLAAGYTIPPGELSLVRIATSPSLGLSWVPGSPVNFAYSAYGEEATGFPPPTEPLRTALLGYPDGNLPSSIPFPGVEPVLKVLRTIRQVNLTWYGQLEARQLR